MKAFVIDVARCNGCMNCQIACKDEHCGTDWLPYAAEQPLTGQFWCKVEEKVRGSVPKTRITYVPHIGGQSDALAAAAGDAVVERPDGLMYLDPEKAKGRKDLCEFEDVYWNEALQIPQTCTAARIFLTMAGRFRVAWTPAPPKHCALAMLRTSISRTPSSSSKALASGIATCPSAS